MIIIPAIDIIDGKCVRLTKGDYAHQKIYSKDPVEVARQFADAGFTRLHIVDLDGARAGTIINLAVLENIAHAVNMVIDFGGGVKKITDVENVLNAGAAMVTLGSLAAKQPGVLEEWLTMFGADRFFIGADVLHEQVKISGWQEDTGINIFDLVTSLLSLGITNIFCTDIARDGMMQGPAINLYKKIIAQYPDIKLVASGGVSSVEDVIRLEETGCAGAIIGKAIYEGSISLGELIIHNS